MFAERMETYQWMQASIRLRVRYFAPHWRKPTETDAAGVAIGGFPSPENSLRLAILILELFFHVTGPRMTRRRQEANKIQSCLPTLFTKSTMRMRWESSLPDGPK